MLTLETDILHINRVGAATAKKLKKLGVLTVRDLLFYFPFRYDDFSRVTPIAKLQAGTSANVVGQVELLQNKRSPRRRMYITEALLNDGRGANGHSPLLKVIWFNQPFIARVLKAGDRVSLAGKVEDDYGGLVMISPVYEKIQTPLTPLSRGGNGAIHTQGLVPNYHLTANLTHKQVRFLIKQVIGLADRVIDWSPFEVRKEVRLISLAQAIKKIHFPKSDFDIKQARERLAFDELFLIQLQAQLVKKNLSAARAPAIKFYEAETKKFVDSLPFKLTDAQRKAAWEILGDLKKDKPMSRLLEGDVGSGKTLVALIAMLNVALNGQQAVLMAPTEILARQHFDTICRLLEKFEIKVGLVTRSDKRANYELGIMNNGKNAELKNHNSLFIIHNSQIIIGTHALIQDDVKFKNLALAVIDEQHRFGVEQRAALSMRTNADQCGPNADQCGPMRTQCGLNADDGAQSGLIYEDLTYKIRGAAFEVKKNLGLGHKEKIYQAALEEEFKKLGLKINREKKINVNYKEKKVGVYQPDFLIEDKIIVEIKKLPFIGKFEKEQVFNYLRGSGYKLALLINFANTDIQFERIINSKVRVSPRQSVFSPHLLSMTATPIPRSLALALYGDLELSIINEMPKERKKIITGVVPESKREKAYGFMREQIKQGRQVFVICPLIDLSDKLGVKSVEEEYKKLDKIVFPEIAMGKLHGRMKAAEKEKVMAEFLAGKIKILVATSVVEVGVDVPNASIMMIEGADRFGLAQLHQFRGRVGRSIHQSYCFLFSDSDNEKTLKRLAAVVKYNNGFELAKMDLKFRGPGEVYGLEQKGFPELKMASLFDYGLMKQAREQAVKLVAADATLNKWPALKEKLGEWEKRVHLE